LLSLTRVVFWAAMSSAIEDALCAFAIYCHGDKLDYLRL
jgi:hypothetical protein